MIKGIDVSWHNGAVDWKKVKADGVAFAFIKATQGTAYSKVDYFRTNVPKALAAGVHVGAYHYATFSNVAEAVKEANYFLSVVKDFKLTYPLVLDLEENKKSASRAQLTAAANAFMDVLKNKGYRVMLYTSKGFLDYEMDKMILNNCPLWIARYYKELGMTADIWQHTDKGKVSGIGGYVDMNIAYKDFAPKPKVATNQIGIVTVTADKLNVRSKPDISGEVVGQIRKGEKYKAYDLKYGWYNVGSGWVSGNYVTFKK
jgi:lysozyme